MFSSDTFNPTNIFSQDLDVRSIFTSPQEDKYHVEKRMCDIRAGTTDTIVSLHARRGDYFYNYNTVRQYYKRYVDYVAERVKKFKIVVFSDDNEWCKANLTFNENIKFVTDKYYIGAYLNENPDKPEKMVWSEWRGFKLFLKVNKKCQ